MKKNLLILIIFKSFIFSSTHYYFYNPNIQYGSEAFFHPINTMLNGSYDILRNGSIKSNDITDIQYLNSAENIWANITHPIKNVKKFGVDKFLELEIFNLSFDPKKGHFLPNIANHLLGNGMLYVKMEEWFNHHHYRHPRLMSFGSTTIYQVMNEVVEHPSGKRYVNVDSISDLLIFNPLGFLLFSFDDVKYFFSNILPIQDWSLQPMYNPFTQNLENTGQNYIMHLPFLGNKKIQPFVYWGIHGLAGGSYKMESDNTLSIGFGRVVNRINNEIRTTEFLENTIFFTPDMDGAISIFISKNNSLKISAIFTGPRFYNTEINVYPGVIRLGDFSPGLYLGIGESKGLVLGLSFNELPFGFGKKYK